MILSENNSQHAVQSPSQPLLESYQELLHETELHFQHEMGPEINARTLKLIWQ